MPILADPVLVRTRAGLSFRKVVLVICTSGNMTDAGPQMTDHRPASKAKPFDRVDSVTSFLTGVGGHLLFYLAPIRSHKSGRSGSC